MIFNLIIGFLIIAKFADIPLVSSLPSIQRSPEELANKFEGDILVSPGTTRGVGVRSAGARWPNNTVPYVISSVYTAAEITIIENAMRKIEQLTAINNFICVQFRPKLANDRYYISIINGVGCYSYVGLINSWTTGQNVSLQKSGCIYEGTIMHELLHTLGFWHEQARPDRDDYVRVNWANIATANQKDFQKKTTAEADTLNTPYDYASIMHYGRYYFTSNGYPTIEPLQPNVQIGDRTTLSPIDIQEVRMYYNCSAKVTTTTTTTTTTKTTTTTTTTPTKTTKTTTTPTTKTTTTPTTKTTTTPTTPTTTTSTSSPSLLTSGRWSTTGSLAIGRVGHTSTLLSDGRVITIGGNEGGSSVELYSLTTRTWSESASMINPRSRHTATLLPDGRLFVTGGWYYNTASKTAEIYNPVSNTWTAIGNMNFGRYGHPAVYLPAPMNKILVMGGYGDSTAPLPLQSCELYDFVSNKWTTTTSMINTRTYFTATYLSSMNVVVAIGGSFPDKSAEIFTISTLQWTRSLNPMPDWRQSHTATLLPSGQILVAGDGYGISATYLFNPTTRLFTFAANTTQKRGEASATLLPSGSVLLIGGTYMGALQRSAEIYDYRLNEWRPVTDMNTARFRHTSVLLNDSSSTSPTVLVIGGQQSWMSITDCELFSVNG